MLCPRAVRHVSSEVEDMDTSEARWSWFYLAECGVWHMFEINQSAACSVTSEQIEQNYNRNQLGVMEFCTAKYTYKLDFSGTKSCDEADQLDNWQAASHKACAAFRNKLQVHL